MKTVTKTKVETLTSEIEFGYWNADTEEFIPVTPSTNMESVAKLFDCSPLLVYALVILTESITDNVGADLRSIWKRLDRIENNEPYTASGRRT